jgi:hypothetical protein
VCVIVKKRRPAGKYGIRSITADEPSSFGPRHEVP